MPNEIVSIETKKELQFVDSVNIQAVQVAIQKINTIQATLKSVLVADKDYGLIPGCGKKPALLKPGAEKIQMALGLLIEYTLIKSTEDFESGFFSYTLKAVAKDARANTVIAEGVGHCNTKEKKQKVKSDTTEDAKRQTAIDKANAVLKMAKKRAQVDCILTVASLSDIFTQDIEDSTDNNDNPLCSLNQKNKLKEKIGNAEFAKLMDECGNKLTIDKYNEIMGV